jgi:hypothetical protein
MIGGDAVAKEGAQPRLPFQKWAFFGCDSANMAASP